MIEKPCSVCGEVKTLDAFHVAKGGRYGRAARCKVCYRAYWRTYWHGRKEARKAALAAALDAAREATPPVPESPITRRADLPPKPHPQHVAEVRALQALAQALEGALAIQYAIRRRGLL
jgi:hypothetical protein